MPASSRPACTSPADRLKRAIDVVLVLIGMVLLAPLFAVLAWKVRREFGSPVLFRQAARAARGGVRAAQVPHHDRRARPRRTAAARRAAAHRLRPVAALDLAGRDPGDGQRPQGRDVAGRPPAAAGRVPGALLPEQARRHEVRPGITGWSQINGRNNMSWDEKLALDVWYVDHRSLWLDVRILLRTLWVMVTRQGVSLDGHATTVPFRGLSRDGCTGQDGQTEIRSPDRRGHRPGASNRAATGRPRG
jgi:hypothetical protein